MTPSSSNSELALVVLKAATSGEALSYETMMLIAERLNRSIDPYPKKYRCDKCQDTGTSLDSAQDTFSKPCDCGAKPPSYHR